MSWTPQPGPQAALLTCPIEDVCYGGARGGGKTDGVLGDIGRRQRLYGAGFKGILFRRQIDELEEVTARSRELYDPMGAVYNDSKRRWTFPDKGTLFLRYLKRDSDAFRYGGWQLTYAAFEELGNFPSPKPFDLMWGALRSPHGVPCVRRATCNPGGAGHAWVKRRFIDPGPWKVIRTRPQPEEKPHLFVEQVFIPALLEDNPELMKKDPMYDARLARAGTRKMYRAWRKGDWTAIEGLYFESWNDNKAVPYADMGIKPWWPWWIAIDWGHEHPASIGWFRTDGHKIYLVRWMNVRGASVEQVAARIITSAKIFKENPKECEGIYMGRDSFAKRSADEQTIARRLESFLEAEHFPRPEMAVTDRVNGWRMIDDSILADVLVVAKEATGVVEFLGTAIHDPDHPEDVLKVDAVDGIGGDDDGDMLRYGVMTRLSQPTKPYEQRLFEKIADRKVDPESGAITMVLPEDPNVLAMRARLAEQTTSRGGRSFRPKPRAG